MQCVDYARKSVHLEQKNAGIKKTSWFKLAKTEDQQKTVSSKAISFSVMRDVKQNCSIILHNPATIF
jgi:hypothetical protein